jgi:hypothetical protein
MELSLEPFTTVGQNPWLYVVALLGCASIYTVGKIVVVRMALRGAQSRDRASIIKAVAELFRVGGWFRRGGGAP